MKYLDNLSRWKTGYGYTQLWKGTILVDPGMLIRSYRSAPFVAHLSTLFLLNRSRGRTRRARPYLYSDQEVRQLLEAARKLPSTYSLRPWTYYCLFGLLAVTGLRLGEALNLQCEDIDWAEGLLTLRRTKFGKSRLVPLHASTVKVLAAFAKRRDRFIAECSSRTSSHFFVTKFGTRLRDVYVYRVFWALSRQIGIRSSGPIVAHGYTTSGTDSPLRPCCTGIVPERTLSADCRCSPPIWVMHTSPTLIGT